MKKVLAMIFSLFTIFSVALAFGGCNNANPKTDEDKDEEITYLSGRYDFWGVLDGENEIAVANMTESQIMFYNLENFLYNYYINFNMDGTYTSCATINNKVQCVSNTYVLDKKNITYYMEGGPELADEDRFFITGFIKNGNIYLYGGADKELAHIYKKR